MTGEQRVWGLHCNEDIDLVGSRVAAMGWDELGDLHSLDATFDAFKEAMTSTYPDAKVGTISQWAGQLFRFVHEAQDGDIVVYREKGGGPINIGRLAGPYEYAREAPYRQRRPMEWQQIGLAPSAFPTGARFELGAFLTWFRLKRFAGIWIAALEGAPAATGAQPTAVVGEEVLEEASALDAAAIDQATRDYVTRQLSIYFKGHGFAQLVGHLLNLMGYTTTVSPPGKDYGVDILAHRGVLGLEPPLIKVQVKSSEGSIGAPLVRELLGGLAPAGEVGLFVALGHYTPDALTLARERANLTLIDGTRFIDLLLAHYHRLDEAYRERFPLKRVWARDLSSTSGSEDSPGG
jgi:restriction system protein